MDWRPVTDLGAFLNYTYQRPEFVSGAYDGKDIPMAPRHQFSMGINIGFWEKYRLALIGRYVGERYIINDLDNAMPRAKGYWVGDMKLSYENGSLETFFEVNNLFDKAYSTYDIKKTATTRDVYPGAERNVMMGVRYRF